MKQQKPSKLTTPRKPFSPELEAFLQKNPPPGIAKPQPNESKTSQEKPKSN